MRIYFRYHDQPEKYDDDRDPGPDYFESFETFQQLADHVGYTDEDERDDRRAMFRDPGGNSALRSSSRRNPRNLPCPTCHRPDRLTPADRARGYQCDACADQAEGGWPS